MSKEWTNKLPSVSNAPGSKDMYGNPLMPEGEYHQGFAEGDPSTKENLYAGNVTGDIYLWCGSCGHGITVEDLMGPGHIGHDLKRVSAQEVVDVAQVPREGGSYRVGWETDGIKPMENDPYDVKIDPEANKWDGKL